MLNQSCQTLYFFVLQFLLLSFCVCDILKKSLIIKWPSLTAKMEKFFVIGEIKLGRIGSRVKFNDIIVLETAFGQLSCGRPIRISDIKASCHLFTTPFNCFIGCFNFSCIRKRPIFWGIFFNRSSTKRFKNHWDYRWGRSVPNRHQSLL